MRSSLMLGGATRELVNIWRDQDTHLSKYKYLSKEDWARFVEKCKSKHFAMRSQYVQWL
jgi:hypothetical protein